MAISKKLRFEVFKRDGFICAYCGKAPPAVMLEVDHIEPKSKKGKDDIVNLITACFDCNRGKSNILLDKIPEQLSDNLEVLKEKEAQLKEYRKFVKRIERRENRDINEIDNIYSNHFDDWELSKQFKMSSLKKFLSLLPKHEVSEAMYLAISKHPTDEDVCLKYFCGVCWRKIKKDWNAQ
jgi:hypothetical protein